MLVSLGACRQDEQMLSNFYVRWRKYLAQISRLSFSVIIIQKCYQHLCHKSQWPLLLGTFVWHGVDVQLISWRLNKSGIQSFLEGFSQLRRSGDFSSRLKHQVIRDNDGTTSAMNGRCFVSVSLNSGRSKRSRDVCRGRSNWITIELSLNVP